MHSGRAGTVPFVSNVGTCNDHIAGVRNVAEDAGKFFAHLQILLGLSRSGACFWFCSGGKNKKEVRLIDLILSFRNPQKILRIYGSSDFWERN